MRLVELRSSPSGDAVAALTCLAAVFRNATHPALIVGNPMRLGDFPPAHLLTDCHIVLLLVRLNMTIATSATTKNTTANRSSRTLWLVDPR